nr:immunoglobulin light chain junction region [Macaca mulatta]
CMQGLGFPWTF